jgi:hypothetical protein
MARTIGFEAVHAACSLIIRSKIYLITPKKSAIEIKIEEDQIPGTAIVKLAAR